MKYFVEKLFFVSLLAIFLFSCQNESELSNNVSITNAKTRAIDEYMSETFKWDDTVRITLKGLNAPTTLPWYNGAETQIPYFILNDYKKSDGWEMVYNFCNGNNLDTGMGKHYLVFYNKFTGTLRTYFYNVNNTTTANTTVWGLEFEHPTKLLNGLGYFTEPLKSNLLTKSQSKTIYTNNITNSSTKSLSKGWNCFDIELTYDPDITTSNNRMSITVYDKSISEITLSGSLNLESNGTIITSSTGNPVNSMFDGSIKAAGNSAYEYLKNKNKEKKLWPSVKLDVLNSIFTGNIAPLISSGLNLAFGSFTSKQNSSQSLKFTTQGNISMTGTMSTTFNSNIVPLANLLVPGSLPRYEDHFLPSYNKPLGAWNLSKNPIVWISDNALWEKVYPFGTSSYIYEYTRLAMIDKESIVLNINPEITESVKNYNIESELVYYHQLNRDGNWGSKYNDVPWSYSIQNEYNMRDLIRGEILTDDNGSHSIKNPYIYSQKTPIFPESRVKYVGRKEREIYEEANCGLMHPGFVVKVTLTLYPKEPYNQAPIVMTKSFVPIYKLKKEILDPSYL